MGIRGGVKLGWMGGAGGEDQTLRMRSLLDSNVLSDAKSNLSSKRVAVQVRLVRQIPIRFAMVPPGV